MKIKLDENRPASLVDVLNAFGHDVDTAWDEGLAGRDDATIFGAAQSDGRFLITQDLDFSDVRQFLPGTHHGPLLIRLRSPGRLALSRRIKSLFQTEDVEAWRRCFLVATDTKIRIRKP